MDQSGFIRKIIHRRVLAISSGLPGYDCAMEKEHKSVPESLFDNDELDDAVINADDTGMVAAQHEIAEEEILRAEDELEAPDEK